MTEFDLREEGDRIVASWAIGDLEAPVAVHRICAAIQTSDAACGFVSTTPTERIDAPADFASLFRSFADAARSNRALYTLHDSPWSLVIAANLHAATYVACEPVRDGRGDLHGMLVVVGNAEKNRDSVLIALPRLARICGAIAAREKQSLHAATASHTITNLLTGVVVNVEYAFELIGESGELADADHEKLNAALRHARESALRLARHFDETKRLASPA